jgi:hypothetical protein
MDDLSYCLKIGSNRFERSRTEPEGPVTHAQRAGARVIAPANEVSLDLFQSLLPSKSRVSRVIGRPALSIWEFVSLHADDFGGPRA